MSQRERRGEQVADKQFWGTLDVMRDHCKEIVTLSASAVDCPIFLN